MPGDRVIAVVPVSSSFARKVKDTAQYHNKVINITYGRQAKSAIILDSGHIVVTSFKVKDLAKRIWREDKG
ncbi:MAG: DUF370 domain-containing protein [Thermotogae bacterium]|nr:MAG: DUF370 domain-containing protein [Thermotogota bacterium]